MIDQRDERAGRRASQGIIGKALSFRQSAAWHSRRKARGSLCRSIDSAFEDRLVGCADAGDLDHVIEDREPAKAVIFRPRAFAFTGSNASAGSGVSSHDEFMAITSSDEVLVFALALRVVASPRRDAQPPARRAPT